jgi:peptidoglycan/LPS O-acetylase OafA/YrhL
MQQQKHYFKSIDTLRFLAFVAIFIFHFPIQNSDNGFFTETILAIKKTLFIGVDFFFVLSSFLLTHLALQEWNTSAQFSFKKFMARRILRIWPLYFLMVFAGFVLLPFAANVLQHNVSIPPVGYYLFFVSNFYTVPHVFFLMFLWSIAVEEQLYLLFAIAYKFLIRYLFVFSILLIGIYITYICIAVPAHWAVYYTTVNYLPNFATGALLALFYFNSKDALQKISAISTISIVLIYFATIAAICVALNLKYSISNQLLSKALLCFLFAFTLLEQTSFQNSLFKLERFATLTYLGKRTYGLYCFHGLVFTLYSLFPQELKNGFGNQLLAFVVTFILTVLLALISYRYFESPFLQLKKKFY